VVSVVSVMELLARPFRNERADAVQAVYDFVGDFPNIQVEPVGLDVAIQAARIRALARLDPADALIVATGILAGARVLVTGDREWARLDALPDAPRVLYLS
jgi:predicted nucleic acid-binding protein